jgi:hypothetical protein
VLHGFHHPLHQLSLDRHHIYQVWWGWRRLVRLRLVLLLILLGFSILSFSFWALGQWWRCSATPTSSS